MTSRLDEAEDDGAQEIAHAIRDIQGDHDRPLTKEEAKELQTLRDRLPKPPRKFLRDLGRRLAHPKGD